MECLTPRNGLPCGVCPRCRLNRQRDWTFRLSIERDCSDFVFWLGLTFDEEHLIQVLSSEKAAREPSRHFLESIRKHFGSRLKIKHFLVTEYGDETSRFHHHCLLFVRCPGADFGQKMDLQKELYDYLGCNNWDRSGNTCWPYGGVRRDPLHAGVFPYVTNYVNKPELVGDKPDKFDPWLDRNELKEDLPIPHRIKPFTRISNGIGLDYLDRVDKKRFEDGNLQVWFEGSKKVLPRYYRQKIRPTSMVDMMKAQTEEEKIQITINRMKTARENLDAAYKNRHQYLALKREFERTHSIPYEESLQHLAANEFRRYKDKLKKRQNL